MVVADECKIQQEPNSCYRWSKKGKQWLTDNQGVVELMNFPPYSPELNPQEKVWKALKKHLFDSLVHDRFDATIKKAKLFLKNKTFTYKFV